MTDHHKFRYLLPPGNNFAFVAKFKIWIVISILLMAASIGSLFVNKAVRGEYMNWTIDFKGGTELIYTFTNKTQPGHPYVQVDSAKIRDALTKAGEQGFDVSDIDVEGHSGIIINTPRFSGLKPDVADKARAAFMQKFTDRVIDKASWSGDRLYVRSKKPVGNKEAAPVFASAGLELEAWSDDDTQRYAEADKSSGDYSAQFAVAGLDRQYQEILEKQLEGTQVIAVSSYGVGAKAGDKLRDDAVKSIVYSIFLIMLYLAFRFDIRYAPGAAFATIHDAIMVIGVFAVTWSDVSLVSVAGLLTVMGYSVNDTVIVFDRIRENQAKLKDKKIERIIDISINEMLVRTILTSSTVFATTLIMNIFGTGLVRNFAFAMNIGVIVGTYSSIFLAAPVFMWISRKWYSGPPPARRRLTSIAAPSANASSAEPDEPASGDAE